MRFLLIETATMVKEIKTQFKSSELISQDTIGASVGSELKSKAITGFNYCSDLYASVYWF